MSLPVLVAVGVLGGIGSIARFVLDGAVARRLGRDFPYGTLAVNVSGALALGVLVGVAISGDGYRLIGTGVLGAYTTFSTWMLETHRLAEDGRLRLGALNIVVSLALGVGAAWLGRRIGVAL
ncbi:MAG TPA: fluoride efflux transporter CrcB [Solirubrobacteraceae bacterium]|nr:fluoride efflux transporter CrcB [Solirubrobacteraceae bacterium]